jgi:fido (protein-threonine AMPylation protein)
LIEQELKHLLDTLADEHYLEGFPRREFSRKVAALLSEINRIHPFREEMVERNVSLCAN